MAIALSVFSKEYSEPRSVPSEVDAETLEAARAGDLVAVERFVRHYERTVYSFLSRHTGHGPHVDDLAQEVFIRAYRALPRFELRDDVKVSTWLLTIAVRLVQDARKRRTLPTVPLDEHEPPPIGPTPETERQRRELVRAFECAAAELPDDQRAVFLLAELHGLSMEEIARMTGARQNTVKTRLFRARTRLRELLSGIRETARS